MATRLDVPFLGQQPDVVAESEQALEGPERVVVAAAEVVVVSQPERARKEDAFAPGKAIDPRSSRNRP